MNEAEIKQIQKTIEGIASTDDQALAQLYIAIALFEIAQQLRKRNELEAKRFNP